MEGIEERKVEEDKRSEEEGNSRGRKVSRDEKGLALTLLRIVLPSRGR